MSELLRKVEQRERRKERKGEIEKEKKIERKGEREIQKKREKKKKRGMSSIKKRFGEKTRKKMKFNFRAFMREIRVFMIIFLWVL